MRKHILFTDTAVKEVGVGVHMNRISLARANGAQLYKRILKPMLLFFICLAFCQVSFAAEFCVSSSASLQTALDTAESNEQDDTINVVQGSYLTPGAQFSYSSQEDFSLSLIGGFTTGCSTRELDSSKTILDGRNAHRVFRYSAPNSPGFLRIKGFTIQNGRIQSGSGAGVEIENVLGHTGDIAITSNIFKFNVTAVGFGSALRISQTDANCHLSNNLFHDNSAANGNVALVNCTGDVITIFSNTFTENTSAMGDGGIFTGGSSRLIAMHNIFWGNTGTDLEIDNFISEVTFNNIQTLVREQNNGLLENNLSVVPKFISLTDFRLEETSPLVDAGNPDRLNLIFTTPFEDLDGRNRVLGREIDIGAYEQEESSACYILKTTPGKVVSFCL